MLTSPKTNSFVAVVLCVLGFGITGCGSKGDAKETSGDQKSTNAAAQSVTTVSAEDFTKEFSKDKDAAKLKYKGQEIVIEGEVARVRKSSNGRGIAVTLNGAFEDQPVDKKFRISCTFTNKPATMPKVGDKIRVRGKHIGVVIGSVIAMSSCEMAAE